MMFSDPGSLGKQKQGKGDVEAVSRCPWGGNSKSFSPRSEVQRSGCSEKCRHRPRPAVSFKRCPLMYSWQLFTLCPGGRYWFNFQKAKVETKQKPRIIHKHKSRTWKHSRPLCCAAQYPHLPRWTILYPWKVSDLSIFLGYKCSAGKFYVTCSLNVSL